MQADMDDLVHVHFPNLLEIYEEMYGQFVVEEKGERVIYVGLLKALYGTLQAAWLFWEKLYLKLIDG